MKKGNSILIWLVGVGLLLFTAFRSIHLVSSTLPPDAQILGFAALGGLDLGLLAWLSYANNGARGSQRTVAILMIVTDFSGVCAATLADTLLISGQNAEMVGTVAGWLLPIIICANVGGVVATHLLDPDQALRNAEREVDEELHGQLIQNLRENKGQLAAEVAPNMAQLKRDELAATFTRALTKNTQALNGKNGHAPMSMNASMPNYMQGMSTSGHEADEGGDGLEIMTPEEFSKAAPKVAASAQKRVTTTTRRRG